MLLNRYYLVGYFIHGVTFAKTVHSFTLSSATVLSKPAQTLNHPIHSDSRRLLAVNKVPDTALIYKPHRVTSTHTGQYA